MRDTRPAWFRGPRDTSGTHKRERRSQAGFVDEAQAGGLRSGASAELWRHLSSQAPTGAMVGLHSNSWSELLWIFPRTRRSKSNSSFRRVRGHAWQSLDPRSSRRPGPVL